MTHRPGEALMAVATDYDAPRRTQTEDTDDDSLEALNARRTDTQSSAVDIDETDLNEALELPGADLSNLSEDELTVRVVPQQADEFTLHQLLSRAPSQP